MKLTNVFKAFFASEKAGGVVLVICTIFSLIIANSNYSTSYFSLWNASIAGEHLSHWINDGLMAIFFLMIGLELEREVYNGELSTLQNAALPMLGAIGGMLVPAGIYLIFNYGTATQSGAGIPMATDIAFALGILSLLGNKVPASLKIFLAALAVIDDLGAIIVIAVFYTNTIAWLYLLIAGALWLLLFVLNRLKVYNLIPYIIGGIGIWYCMLHSGVHATIAGVIVAFVIPFGDGSEKSPSYILQNWLHKPVAFLILPLFALANTAIVLGTNFSTIFTEHYSIGILLGLVIGKVVGISVFSFVGIKFGIGSLPDGCKPIHVIGAALLGGIGFTMSVFITLLAFTDEVIINNTKLVILVGSLIAGLLGFCLLKFTLKNNIEEASESLT
ncbi:Na+/H+ antiporter NhaA [Ferruginibacter yonginensis]|uniref:Na(+)/H(+) antiporter NhaA n=1 Tax=Ferruginibacter yonginensis TaxID=1310416 RepID=A0ABV8QRL5_9BACT